MKIYNILLGLSFIVATLTVTSCTSEYRCQCTIEYTGGAGLPTSSVNEYPIKDTKKKAKDLCESRSASFEKDGVKTNEKCILF